MQTTKTIFSCQKCEAQTAKWAGRCLECGTWGSLVEEVRNKNQESRVGLNVKPAKPMALHEIQTSKVARLATGIEEVDRVLGGGIVAGSTILLAGEPGIGKSTLVAQIAQNIYGGSASVNDSPNKTLTEAQPPNILYVSGEESPEQLKGRFERLQQNVITNNISILLETNTETIAATIEVLKPALTIIDSVQTLTSNAAEDAGAITQLRASAAILNEIAKRISAPILLIGQVTKSLDIAGPKSLEHLVDVVLTFEGDRSSDYRILRAEKNRFGGTGEIGVFEMTNVGLREVKNPSASFLKIRSDSPGSIATCVLQGTRPIIVEVQALVSRSYFPYPERRASGFDLNRLNLLLAVLEKHGSQASVSFSPNKTSYGGSASVRCHPHQGGGGKQVSVSSFNIHINITSGLKINEPSADLAVILAIASSLGNKTIPQDTIAFGELGLGGELRPVRDASRRISEARKLDFKHFLVPANSNIKPEKDIHCFHHLSEVINFLELR